MPDCKYGDPLCPCQDGDSCHYEGDNPMTPPVGISVRYDRSGPPPGTRYAVSGVLWTPNPSAKRG